MTLPELVESLETNLKLFSVEANMHSIHGVKAAGKRARKISLTIEKQLKEYRKFSVWHDSER